MLTDRGASVLGGSNEGRTMPEPVTPDREVTLTVVRTSARPAWFVPVEIQLDGRTCGLVKNGDFTVIRCRPGMHDVVVKQGAHSSQVVSLTVPSGGRSELVCGYKTSTNRFARTSRVVMFGLVAFAVLYVVVPPVKPALKPYESYWGPVFVIAVAVAMTGLLSEVPGQVRWSRSREPGTVLELTRREPTVSEERIRSKWLDQIAAGGGQ
jgi:hypothetical protein